MRFAFAPKTSLPILEFRMVNSCNGLLCLSGESRDDPLYVCNPILGEFITIPPNDKARYRAPLDGFGFSVETNQYKVLQSFYPMVDPECRSIDYLEVEIYTIGTGVWRSIGNAPSDFLKFPFSALLHGALHWVSLAVESAKCIHSFSFETEQFRSLPLPSNYGRVEREFHDLLKLGVLGGCLVLCVFGGCASRELDMWVMKDYGVQESSCY
ncbi:PREDICTED: F-box protein At3g07870-like [Prunus mume]|uniref:F-box protein At3g07870-like n=1 Tax=Prunus mume TaxID=102107 RepID=A0ABM0NDD9_PRUMU|nr:PREDICTED: F-box protein At3g07870-like [Prunus mume]